MATQKKDNNQQYTKAREEFDGLKIEEKAIFLVESTFSMLAHGIEAVGNVFSEQVEKVYETVEEEVEEKAPPKTTQRKSTARKKTTKTTRKRSTSSRSSKKTNTDKTD